MSSLTPAEQNPFWSSFTHDPRDPAYSGLRAADADRAIVTDLLASAYADGRLSAAEHDQLQSKALGLATLAQIPALVEGLVAGPSVPAVVHAKAVAMHRESLRSTFLIFAIPAAISWVLALFVGFFAIWPLWVSLLCAIPFALTYLGGKGAIDNNERKLTRTNWEG